MTDTKHAEIKLHIKVTELPGRLRLQIDPEEQAALQAERERLNADGSDAFGCDDILYELFEHLICNSEYQWIPEGQIALLSAPVLGVYRDDPSDPGHEQIVKFWAFMNYAVTSPQEQLANTGECYFTEG